MSIWWRITRGHRWSRALLSQHHRPQERCNFLHRQLKDVVGRLLTADLGERPSDTFLYICEYTFLVLSMRAVSLIYHTMSEVRICIIMSTFETEMSVEIMKNMLGSANIL